MNEDILFCSALQERVHLAEMMKWFWEGKAFLHIQRFNKQKENLALYESTPGNTYNKKKWVEGVLVARIYEYNKQFCEISLKSFGFTE